MKKFQSAIAIFCLAVWLSPSQAATRVFDHSVLVGAKDVLVGGRLYDVDLSRFFVTEPFPGPASPFLTMAQAQEAIAALYTQVVGDGTGMYPGSLLSTFNYVGSPEDKHFSVVQRYGDMLSPTASMAVDGQFHLTLVMPPIDGQPWVATASLSIGFPYLTEIPAGPVSEGPIFPTWRLSSSTPVPEPSAFLMALAGIGAMALIQRLVRLPNR